MGLSLLKNLFICRDCLYALNWIVARVNVRIILQSLLGNNVLSTVRVSVLYTKNYDIHNIWHNFNKLHLTFSLRVRTALLFWAHFASCFLICKMRTINSGSVCIVPIAKIVLRNTGALHLKSTMHLCMKYCCHTWHLDKQHMQVCRTVAVHLKLLWTFGSLSKYGQILYSGRRTTHFKKMHDFLVTIPRYYKDVIMWCYNIKTSEVYTWQSYKRKKLSLIK